MNNVLLNEAQLESLITRYESKIIEISGKLEEIKNKTKIVDGDTEIWRSRAQQEFKLKKDNYVGQFDAVINEHKKELDLLKEALTKLKQAEHTISTNIDTQISDVM